MLRGSGSGRNENPPKSRGRNSSDGAVPSTLRPAKSRLAPRSICRNRSGPEAFSAAATPKPEKLISLDPSVQAIRGMSSSLGRQSAAVGCGIGMQMLNRTLLRLRSTSRCSRSMTLLASVGSFGAEKFIVASVSGASKGRADYSGEGTACLSKDCIRSADTPMLRSNIPRSAEINTSGSGSPD